MKDVLVAYASKYGSTGEIAEKIGEVLGQNDLNVTVLYNCFHFWHSSGSCYLPTTPLTLHNVVLST